VLGAPATELAAAAEAIQDLLGEHQDTVVARQSLREIGVRAHLSGENGFTFGRLHSLEEARAAALVSDYPARRDALPEPRTLKRRS
jgi:CHAD domain-containing protein